MTDKAKRLLAQEHHEMLLLTLERSFQIFDYDMGIVKGVFTNRYGMDIDTFLSDLSRSLDKVPWVIYRKGVRKLEALLARLDTVDGTEDEWGILAKALLEGLELKLDKKDVMRKFPDAGWGVEAYKRRLGDEKYTQCIDYAQKKKQVFKEQIEKQHKENEVVIHLDGYRVFEIKNNR